MADLPRPALCAHRGRPCGGPCPEGGPCDPSCGPCHDRVEPVLDLRPVIQQAACPIPGCGRPLSLVRTFQIDITATTQIRQEIHPNNSWVDYWEIHCEEGHIVGAGSKDDTGFSPEVGYRLGQILGGVR